MFLHNFLTIRNIQLGRCGTKTHSSLVIRRGSRLHDKGEISEVIYQLSGNKNLIKDILDFPRILLEIRTYQLVLITISLYLLVSLYFSIPVFL